MNISFTTTHKVPL